jgi:inorganic triphosphatase YgiF
VAEELELKLTVAKEVAEQAFSWLRQQEGAGICTQKHLINRYYDTPGADISRQKAALRVRQVDGHQYIQTLKTQGTLVGGVHHRQEWEWSLTRPVLDLDLLAQASSIPGSDLKGLDLVFETDFTRRIVMLDDGCALIECAVDSGVVSAGDNHRQLHEVEFELKSGDPRHLLVWAERLAKECPVFVNLISKAEQGYHLAGLYSPVVVGKQSDVVIDLFRRMGTAWLTGLAVDLGGLNIDELAAIAQRKSVTKVFQNTVNELLNGSSPGELMIRPEFGQMQFALLR